MGIGSLSLTTQSIISVVLGVFSYLLLQSRGQALGLYGKTHMRLEISLEWHWWSRIRRSSQRVLLVVCDATGNRQDYKLSVNTWRTRICDRLIFIVLNSSAKSRAHLVHVPKRVVPESFMSPPRPIFHAHLKKSRDCYCQWMRELSDANVLVHVILRRSNEHNHIAVKLNDSRSGSQYWQMLTTLNFIPPCSDLPRHRWLTRMSQSFPSRALLLNPVECWMWVNFLTRIPSH